jgi:hypothetical protein
MKAVFQLVRLDSGRGGAELRALGERLGGAPGAIARAAAFIIEDDVGGLAAQVVTDRPLARSSPQPYLHVARVLAGAPALFAAWGEVISHLSTGLGVSAFRAFLGDVAEAAFRTLQLGADPDALLGQRRGELVDLVSAELPGTTDFLAARGMAWLLGALAPSDDAARTALERARRRFHAPSFQADCEAMLTGKQWPPAQGQSRSQASRVEK